MTKEKEAALELQLGRIAHAISGLEKSQLRSVPWPIEVEVTRIRGNPGYDLIPRRWNAYVDIGSLGTNFRALTKKGAIRKARRGLNRARIRFHIKYCA